jgi:hypothetical protein
MIAVQEKFMMKRLARDCGPSFTVAGPQPIIVQPAVSQA